MSADGFERWRDLVRDELVRQISGLSSDEASELADNPLWLAWWKRGSTPREAAAAEALSRQALDEWQK